MNRVLLKLERAILYYGIPHLNEEEHVKADQNLLAIIFQLEQEFVFRHGNKEILLLTRKSFRLFYRQLCNLLDELYRYKHKQADETILKYYQFLAHIETSYSKDMDPQASLTQFHLHVLKTEMMEQFPALKATLIEKDVSECFLIEIQHVLEDQFRAPGRNLSYEQQLFFIKLLRVLRHIAHDTWDRDYNHCFIKFMISINFNHIGFLNQCFDLLDKTLEDIADIDKQRNYLNDILFKLKQVARYSTVQFDSKSNSLSKKLIQYVKKKISSIGEIPASRNYDSDENRSIFSNLTAGGLTVYHHYFQKVKFSKGETKKLGGQNFVNPIDTANGIKITEAQHPMFDKTKLHHEIRILKNKLMAIIDQLNKDLDDSATSSKNKPNTA